MTTSGHRRVGVILHTLGKGEKCYIFVILVTRFKVLWYSRCFTCFICYNDIICFKILS